MSKMWAFFAALQILILITANNQSFAKPANVETFFAGVEDIINLAALKEVSKDYAGDSFNSWFEKQDQTMQKVAGFFILAFIISILASICFIVSVFKRNEYVDRAK